MRTDDDSWDITTGVGATALGVAILRAVETRRPDPLFRDPYAEQLVAAVGVVPWDKVIAGDADDAERAAARAAFAPTAAVLAARTRYFDDYFADALRAGIRQIVVLAAGLDARAYRLDWPSDAVVYELDQPKVLDFKAAALDERGVAPAVDRRAVGVDLRRDWPTALRDAGFVASRPTAWLAEGLLRYLSAEAQDRLLADVVAAGAPGSRVALNVAADLRGRSPGPRERRTGVLADLGIELDLDSLWYPDDGRSDPREWFAARGWTVRTDDPAALLARHGRDVAAAVRAECERHTFLTAVHPE